MQITTIDQSLSEQQLQRVYYFLMLLRAMILNGILLSAALMAYWLLGV